MEAHTYTHACALATTLCVGSLCNESVEKWGKWKTSRFLGSAKQVKRIKMQIFVAAFRFFISWFVCACVPTLATFSQFSWRRGMLSAYMLGVHCSRIFVLFFCVCFLCLLLLFFFYLQKSDFSAMHNQFAFLFIYFTRFSFASRPLCLFIFIRFVANRCCCSFPFFACPFLLIVASVESNLFHLNTFSSGFVFHFRLSCKNDEMKPTQLEGNTWPASNTISSCIKLYYYDL